MPIANCTGAALPYRVDGIIKIFASRGPAWTSAEVARNDHQGVAFIVPRGMMTLADLDRTRCGPDQYYGVPVLDEEGLLVAIEWSTGEKMPIAEMVEFKASRLRPRVDVVVTRHAPLVVVLRERGIIREDTPIIEHATPEAVTGKHVLGVLPHWLSCLAASITEVPMAGLTQADREAMTRGDLGVERTRDVAGDPVSYVVHRV
jgi:hypothetical protein